MDDEAWSPINGLIDDCEAAVASLNRDTVELLGRGNLLLKQLSLPRPKKGCSELVFLRTVFWLSALLHECGGRPVKYCMRQSQFRDSDECQKRFLSELQSIRTQAAHNLDPSLTRDVITDTTCRNWFRRACQVESPFDDSQWNDCSKEILLGAFGLLGNLQTFLRFLKNTGEADLLLDGLQQAISAEVSPYAFDDIVTSVAVDLGRSDLNLSKFRADHFSRWVEGLERLPEGYDFSFEARRLVEKSFNENPEPPPITGRDIIETLRVPPGREVGRLLDRAILLFREGCRSKEVLLEKLRPLVASEAVPERAPARHRDRQ
jgi:hypothetical protein